MIRKKSNMKNTPHDHNTSAAEDSSKSKMDLSIISDIPAFEKLKTLNKKLDNILSRFELEETLLKIQERNKK